MCSYVPYVFNIKLVVCIYLSLAKDNPIGFAVGEADPILFNPVHPVKKTPRVVFQQLVYHQFRELNPSTPGLAPSSNNQR